MAASSELQRVATNLDNAGRGIQNHLDIVERALNYYSAQGLDTELSGLAADADVTGEVSKERLESLIGLLASLAFYLRDVSDGSGNTITGDPELGPAGLQSNMKEVGI